MVYVCGVLIRFWVYSGKSWRLHLVLGTYLSEWVVPLWQCCWRERKEGLNFLLVLFDLTSALKSGHVLKENKLSKIISRCYIVGSQQYSPWCHPKKSQWRLDKDLGDSVQFVSLMDWQMFFWMFVCLNNRKLFVSSDICELLSMLD